MKNGAHNSCPQADKNGDMFGLNEIQRIKYIKEDRPDANETTNTSETGDSDYRGRTDELTQPVERAKDYSDIHGHTGETASGADGRMSSSSRTRAGSRLAETPNNIHTTKRCS